VFLLQIIVHLAKYLSGRKRFCKKFVEKNEIRVCVPTVSFSHQCYDFGVNKLIFDTFFFFYKCSYVGLILFRFYVKYDLD
jgi:hypothetical protein